MKIKVALVSFGTFQTRYVDVPSDTTEDNVLDRVFHYGQNEFQNQPVRSVSVGDIIFLNGVALNPKAPFVTCQGWWVVDSIGFKKLSNIDEVWDHIANEGSMMFNRLMGEVNEYYRLKKAKVL